MKIDINKVELKLTDTDDPIATQIKWTPAKEGGSNFKTSTLETIDNQKISIKPSPFFRLFLGAFVGFGFLFAITGAINGDIMQTIFSAIFAAIPFKLLAKELKTIYFDKANNSIYEKKHVALQKFDPSPLLSENINEVHAIQIVGEHVSSKGSGGRTSNYNSYEINLVFKNLRRVCIIDHAQHNSILEDAQTISTFLNVPLWDAT
ncbi:hypothetical protein [Algibacillus agarilyticus]|uniref:hypothetical protein n=1 Tax=Algibacillus agarilyticus TaxID=2234133 RepID=UPI000DD01C67|nr:hypothetical protein [Algibacillus agarilyticus]